MPISEDHPAIGAPGIFKLTLGIVSRLVQQNLIRDRAFKTYERVIHARRD